MSFQILPPELHSHVFSFVEPHLLAQVCQFSRKEAFTFLQQQLETGALQETAAGRRWRHITWYCSDRPIPESLFRLGIELFEEIKQLLKWTRVGTFERPSLLDLSGMQTLKERIRVVSSLQDLRTILPNYRLMKPFWKLFPHTPLAEQAKQGLVFFQIDPIHPFFGALPRKKCEQALLPLQNGPAEEGEYPFAPEILFRLPSLNGGSWDKLVQLALDTHQPEALLAFIRSPRFSELPSLRPLFIKACERGYVDVVLALLTSNRNAPLFENEKRLLKFGIGRAIFHSQLYLVITLLEHPLCDDRHLFHNLLLDFQEVFTRLLHLRKFSPETALRLKGWAQESGLSKLVQRLDQYLLPQ